MAVEEYIRGVINPVPYNNCTRGVKPYTRDLLIYLKYISVPVEADADIDDLDI